MKADINLDIGDWRVCRSGLDLLLQDNGEPALDDREAYILDGMPYDNKLKLMRGVLESDGFWAALYHDIKNRMLDIVRPEKRSITVKNDTSTLNRLSSLVDETDKTVCSLKEKTQEAYARRDEALLDSVRGHREEFVMIASVLRKLGIGLSDAPEVHVCNGSVARVHFISKDGMLTITCRSWPMHDTTVQLSSTGSLKTYSDASSTDAEKNVAFFIVANWDTFRDEYIAGLAKSVEQITASRLENANNAYDLAKAMSAGQLSSTTQRTK